MARARMIARNITKSKKIAQLNDQERVIYAFILPFLDREGRINAHPTYLKGNVFLGLEYTEAQIDEATRRFHDVGLATIYPTEDAVVMEYASFAEFNRPNHREVESEFPPPSDELRNRVETRPSSTRQKAPPVNARETPGKRPESYRAEVEVEGEGEGEGTKNEPTGVSTPSPTAQSEKPPPPKKRERGETFNLIKTKLRTANHPVDPDVLLMECLEEDSGRDAWFELPPNQVRKLISDATRRYRKGEVKFKTELIVLLDRATVRTRYTTKPAAADPFDVIVAEYERNKNGVKRE